MRNIKILTDSCSDLNGELLEKYNIDYARMNTVRDGVETEASLTWEHYSPKELYDIMRGGNRITTTQVPAPEFMRIFTKYLEEGFDIIYIGCSLKQSGSVNTGRIVANGLLKNFPGARIECIDAKRASLGEGILAIYAAECLQAGDDYDTIVSKVLGKRNNVNQFVTVNTLEWLRKAGRVKGSAAFFGNLMGVKPILIADADGEQTPIKKVKGRTVSFTTLADSLNEVIDNPSEATVYVAHADITDAELEVLKKLIKEKINPKEIVISYIGPIIGASIGPDAVGIWGFGKGVTYRISEVN